MTRAAPPKTARISTVEFDELSLGEEVGFRNPRTSTGLDRRSIDDLANDIALRGLIDPLHVWATEGEGRIGYTIVLRGQRRYRAIERLIEQKRANGLGAAVPIIYVQAANLLDAMTFSLIDVAQRSDLSTYELAEAMDRLKQAGLTGKQIADRLSKSETWVSRITKAFAAASPTLRKAWKAGDVPDDAAKMLADMDEADQDKAVEDYVGARKVGTRKAKAKAKEVVVERTAARVKRPDPKLLAEYLELCELARSSSDYVKGMHHTLLFVLGHAESDVFGDDWERAVATAQERKAKKPKKAKRRGK